MQNKICPEHIIANQVSNALYEDLGFNLDWTSSLINSNQQSAAIIKSRDDMILCGCAWAEQAFRILDLNSKITWFFLDGQQVKSGDVICEISGNSRALLTAERTALNFLQTLSATATITQEYVKQIIGTNAKIMDTRKTIPNLRLAQKYAVVVGGGYNQRFGLYDGVLIKENHISACGGVANAIKMAQATVPRHVTIQIEVETVEQLQEALNHNAKLILLDNMDPETITKCVKINSSIEKLKQAELETSGNINIDNVREYALTGIDRISIGALTKNIKAIDLSMRII